jgi:CheY-like chemotaxis protein
MRAIAAMRVLIVEDNATVRRLIRTIIAGVASEIHECEDGASAFTAYVEYRPDFVLMDIEMKGMDGIAAAVRIKTDYPAANIIMVTSYDDIDLREYAREAGACGYVVKHSLSEIKRVLMALAPPQKPPM